MLYYKKIIFLFTFLFFTSSYGLQLGIFVCNASSNPAKITLNMYNNAQKDNPIGWTWSLKKNTCSGVMNSFPGSMGDLIYKKTTYYQRLPAVNTGFCILDSGVRMIQNPTISACKACENGKCQPPVTAMPIKCFKKSN